MDPVKSPVTLWRTCGIDVKGERSMVILQKVKASVLKSALSTQTYALQVWFLDRMGWESRFGKVVTVPSTSSIR